MHHWHVCDIRNCTILGDKNEHDWEVTIIKEATQNEPGKKRFVCKVCGFEKEETYASTSYVTKEEFEKATSQSSFANVTCLVKVNDELKTTLEFANGYVRINGLCESENSEKWYSSYGIANIFDGIAFEDLSFDQPTRTYFCKLNEKTVAVQFADKAVSVITVTENETVTKYEFSSYGETKFEN